MTDFEIETWIKIIQADQEAQRQGFLSAFWSPEDDEEEAIKYESQQKENV